MGVFKKKPVILGPNKVPVGAKMNFKVTTRTNKANGEITQKTESEIDGAVTKAYVQVIKTQEQGFRDALIGLGWTPPKGK